MPDARLAHDRHDLAVPGARRLPRPLQLLQLLAPPDEARQAAVGGHLDARAQRPDALQLVDAQRVLHAFHREQPQVAEPEEPLHQPRGVLGEVDAIGLGELLHARGQADGVALRRVVHAQVVADLADHDLAGVEAHAHGEVAGRAARAQVLRHSAQLLAQVQGRVAGALRVVLVRDRRAEQRHDAVAGVLVHRALEAMHAVGEDLEEAVEDAGATPPDRPARPAPSSPSRRRTAP